MNDSINCYLKDLRKLTKEYGIKIFKGKGKRINCDGIRVGGYFCDEDMILAYASNRKLESWLGILVHESCHMDQWIEDSAEWQAATADEYTVQEDYFNKKKVTKKAALQSFNSIIALEADCERRALVKMKAYDLPMNFDYYAQGANSYLISYTAMYNHKRWHRKAPYDIGSIIDKMDTVIAPTEDYHIGKIKDVSIFEPCF